MKAVGIEVVAGEVVVVEICVSCSETSWYIGVSAALRRNSPDSRTVVLSVSCFLVGLTTCLESSNRCSNV